METLGVSVDSGVTCTHLLFLILRFMFTSALDNTIGSMLGVESTENRVYAYDNDMETLSVSVDSAVTCTHFLFLYPTFNVYFSFRQYHR